jgi:hypothetical protein
MTPIEYFTSAEAPLIRALIVARGRRGATLEQIKSLLLINEEISYVH